MKWFTILLIVVLAFSLLRIVTQIRKATKSSGGDWDERFIGQLRKAGMASFDAYPVDFFFDLPSTAACDAVAAELEPEGYSVDSRQEPDSSNYSLHATRSMRLLVPDMQALTVKFRALAELHGGKYDGWAVAKKPKALP